MPDKIVCWQSKGKACEEFILLGLFYRYKPVCFDFVDQAGMRFPFAFMCL